MATSLHLLWGLCLLVPTHADVQAGEWAPVPQNSTLLFDIPAHSNSLRNCSCASEIQDCNYALANLLCSCHTVTRTLLPPDGLHACGRLTVWMQDAWLLHDLLNGSTVRDLRLSSCGSPPLAPPQYVALFGLHRLQVYTSLPSALHREQAVTIASGMETSDLAWTTQHSPDDLYLVSFLDVSLLSGNSSLKAYSVSSSSTDALSQHFPRLPLLHLTLKPNQTQGNCLFTFIY